MTTFTMPTTLPSLTGSSAGALGNVFTSTPATTDSTSFAQTLQSAFAQVNSLQNHSGQMTQAFAQGKISDIHTVMIASEQASVALQLTTQIRNKAVEAYQEIMRISM